MTIKKYTKKARFTMRTFLHRIPDLLTKTEQHICILQAIRSRLRQQNFPFTRVCSECYDLRIKLIETKRCDGAAQRKTRKVKLSVRRDLIDNASRKITLLLTSHILQIEFEV